MIEMYLGPSGVNKTVYDIYRAFLKRLGPKYRFYRQTNQVYGGIRITFYDEHYDMFEEFILHEEEEESAESSYH